MSLGEFSIIERYFTSRSHRDDVLLGVGDDAALLKLPPGMQLAVSIDTLVAGRHFPADTAAEAIGHKALAVNLSDMAAMGAEPAWATLALTLPEPDPIFIEAFAGGFFRLAQAYGIELVGGDTVRGPLTVTVQIHGLVPDGEALLRSGACPGDYLYITGNLGDAGGGLGLRQGGNCSDSQAAAELLARLDYPEPRVAEGCALRGVASAAIDISDGLLADLGHILERSGCAAEIDLGALPLSPALRGCVTNQQERLKLALSAGDDYELCFAVPPHRRSELEALSRSWSCAVSCIGRVSEGAGITLKGEGSDALQGLVAGFDHFRR
ncbi:MAG: thiamine-phosphate kinase [Gammaproteobacteria bacterium]|nr:thiamine-phosphate kinase [Gammaproteobacteria bacterium]MCW8991591.1 thiamine-phosphate kinase [Gammaproteobacteria bacterium]